MSEDQAEIGAAPRGVERAPDGEPVARVFVERGRGRRRGLWRTHCRMPAVRIPVAWLTSGGTA